MNILKFIDTVLCPDTIDPSRLPEELGDKNMIRYNESNFNIVEFISVLNGAQKSGYVLVVTHKKAIANVVEGVNGTISSNKVSVLCNRELNAEGLEKELNSKAFHTDDGKVLFPEAVENFKSLLHSDNRIIIKKKPYGNEQVVRNVRNEVVGVLLDESYRYSDIIGTVKEHVTEISVREKALMMLEIMKNNSERVNSFSDIVIFKTAANKHKFLALPSSVSRSLYDAELELFTGYTTSNSITEIVTALAELSLPAVINEDLNAILTNHYVSNTMPLPKREIIENSMRRIVL